MKTEYEEDSVFQKVSRNSYLTSSSAQNSNGMSSSESEIVDGSRRGAKRGNLIVKKKREH